MCEKFHCLPSQLARESTELMAMLDIVQRSKSEQPEGSDSTAELSPEMKDIIEDKAKAQGLGLG